MSNCNLKEAMKLEQGYKKLAGIVTSLTKHENGQATFEVEEVDGNSYRINVFDTNIVFDTHGVHVFLEEGQVFQAFVSYRKPMILIHPPQYAPDLIVVESEELGFVEVSYFNDDFVNKENTLKLHIDDSVVIQDLEGTPLTVDEVKSSYAAAFYQASTRSIPAQTTPKKLLKLSE
jgi:hypothetical protein